MEILSKFLNRLLDIKIIGGGRGDKIGGLGNFLKK